jgi:hypothetical protein
VESSTHDREVRFEPIRIRHVVHGVVCVVLEVPPHKEGGNGVAHQVDIRDPRGRQDLAPGVGIAIIRVKLIGNERRLDQDVDEGQQGEHDDDASRLGVVLEIGQQEAVLARLGHVHWVLIDFQAFLAQQVIIGSTMEVQQDVTGLPNELVLLLFLRCGHTVFIPLDAVSIQFGLLTIVRLQDLTGRESIRVLVSNLKT